MSKRLAPPFFDGTTRQWKAQKRKEWNAIIKAVDVFHLGCAYTPVFDKERRTIVAALKSGKVAMSPKIWKGKP